MQTYDSSDLLDLDGKLMCADGRYLKIQRVTPLPKPPDLFDQPM